MTRNQLNTLHFIRGYLEEYGYAPSFQEISDSLGYKSKSQVHRLIMALEEQNKIRRLPNRSRSIELVDNPALPPRITLEAIVKSAAERGLVVGTIVHKVVHNRDGTTDRARQFVPVDLK